MRIRAMRLIIKSAIYFMVVVTVFIATLPFTILGEISYRMTNFNLRMATKNIRSNARFKFFTKMAISNIKCVNSVGRKVSMATSIFSALKNDLDSDVYVLTGKRLDDFTRSRA